MKKEENKPRLTPLDSPLGKAWYENFYESTIGLLGYSKARDEESRDKLSTLLYEKKVPEFDVLFQELKIRYRNKNCVIFGAGPSLREDIQRLYPVARKTKNLVIAADGAADALADASIIPQLVISDLDSCSEEQLASQSESRVLFVHSHGDNKKLLETLVPKMGNRVLGTTQVASIQNVRNLGGLTDGDRACYIASLFDPKVMVFAGMDFGTLEGEYSRDRRARPSRAGDQGSENPKRAIKMRLGKESLEFLIRRESKTRYVNMTSHGDTVIGARIESLESVMKELS